MKAIQQTIVDESQVQFKRIAEQEKGNMDAQTLEKTIQTQYHMMTTSMMQTLQNMFKYMRGSRESKGGERPAVCQNLKSFFNILIMFDFTW